MFRTCPLIRVSEYLLPIVILTSIVDRATAGECGDHSPDYRARRTITIGANTRVVTVYVSGNDTREEDSGAGGRHTVVIRLPEQGTVYVFDPDRKEGTQMRFTPPPPLKQHGRQMIDSRSDGTIVRRNQLPAGAGGEWKDVSTTVCRSDGVMLEQQFVLPDAHGNPLGGRLTQDDIVVGPLAKSLFQVPDSVVITHGKAPPSD